MNHRLFGWTLAVYSSASVAGAVIQVGEVKTVPRLDGQVTTAGRPSLHNGTIVFGQTEPNNVGVTYDTATGTLKTWGGVDDPIDVTRNAAGFFQNEQTGVGGKWAVVGGAPEVQSLNVPIKVVDLETNTRTDVLPDPNVASGVDQHFFDINANGDLVWVSFGANGEGNLIWTNMKDPSQQAALTTVTGGTSLHPRISKDSGRRITYSPTSTTHRVFDLETMTDYLVYESASGENVLRSRISDDGNWIIANHRAAGETLKRSDIILVSIADLSKPASFSLTKDPTVIREDPNIEIVDADTAIVVWGQDSTADVEDNYDIYAATVTGLAAKTPVLGAPVLLAAGDGGTGRGNRFPVIDGDLVAWSYHWGDPDSQTVQYLSIAEAAAIPESKITKASKTSSAFELSFQTIAGYKYAVEFTDSLSTPLAWSTLPAVTPTGPETTVTQADPVAGARFYRVRVERP